MSGSARFGRAQAGELIPYGVQGAKIAKKFCPAGVKRRHRVVKASAAKARSRRHSRKNDVVAKQKDLAEATVSGSRKKT